MTNEKQTGGPAFPQHVAPAYRQEPEVWGMTLRQYAAIKLKVPDSGTDWLDEMIRKSKRDEIAAKAMQGLLANPERYSYIASLVENGQISQEEASMKNARKSYLIADALMKAREL